MKQKTAQSRLAYRLRALGEKQDPELKLKCDRAAMNLDKTIASLGVRGARVKTLGAYIAAKQVFEGIKGEAYVD